jgi:hypothetical protein
LVSFERVSAFGCPNFNIEAFISTNISGLDAVLKDGYSASRDLTGVVVGLHRVSENVF